MALQAGLLEPLHVVALPCAIPILLPQQVHRVARPRAAPQGDQVRGADRQPSADGQTVLGRLAPMKAREAVMNKGIGGAGAEDVGQGEGRAGAPWVSPYVSLLSLNLPRKLLPPILRLAWGGDHAQSTRLSHASGGVNASPPASP
jgi:hypothetical protein